MQDDTPALDNTDGAADLAAEATPPPEMPAEDPPFAAADLSEEQFTERFKRQYLEREARRAQPLGPREQAHALQRQLNEMRAAARGEVPEAAAMKQEIQRLFDLADSQTNASARQGIAPPGDDPLSQARRILADLNAGRIPPAQRAEAQAAMQRLYAAADAQANARTAAPTGDNLRNRRAG